MTQLINYIHDCTKRLKVCKKKAIYFASKGLFYPYLTYPKANTFEGRRGLLNGLYGRGSEGYSYPSP